MSRARGRMREGKHIPPCSEDMQRGNARVDRIPRSRDSVGDVATRSRENLLSITPTQSANHSSVGSSPQDRYQPRAQLCSTLLDMDYKRIRPEMGGEGKNEIASIRIENPNKAENQQQKNIASQTQPNPPKPASGHKPHPLTPPSPLQSPLNASSAADTPPPAADASPTSPRSSPARSQNSRGLA